MPKSEHPLIIPGDPESTAHNIRALLCLVDQCLIADIEGAGTPPTGGQKTGCLIVLNMVDEAVRWLGHYEYNGNVTELGGKS